MRVTVAAGALIVLIVLMSGLHPLQAQSHTITVTAGDLDRHQTVVSFQLPDDLAEGVYRLESESGSRKLLQVDDRNRGRFILERLDAGNSKRFRLLERVHVATATGSALLHEIDHNTVSLKKEGSRVLTYYHRDNEPPAELDERYRRGGYIHPVLTPEGTVLTNHLNVGMHPHHLGIWSAWTRTRFQGRTPDFWNPHANSGRVDHADSLDMAWAGPVHTGFRACHFFTDLSAESPVVALNEQWEVRLYGNGARDFHMFDLNVDQSVNTSQPLHLPEYHYGGIGFRGHSDWDDPENVRFLTSEGLGREGNATRARWIRITGTSDGRPGSIVILGHPENPRHPQNMRIHPEESFFNWAPTQLGEMTIRPGEPYRVRYRYVTFDREPAVEQVERLWLDYAYPPGVTVTGGS